MALIRALLLGFIFLDLLNLSQQLVEETQLPKISFKELHHNLHNQKQNAKYFETIRDKGLKISSHLDLQQKNIFDVKNMKKIFAKVLLESYEKFRYFT